VSLFLRRARAPSSRLRGDERGAVFAFVALILMVLIGFSALAIDVGHLYLSRARLQSAADAAVLAAAQELPDTGSALAKLHEFASKNLAAERYGTVVVESDVGFGQWNAGGQSFTAGASPANAVRVTARMAEANSNPVSLFFGRALGFATVDVVVEAVATASRPVCLLALEPSASQALYLDSNAQLNAPGCTVHVNSSNSRGIELKSNSGMAAAGICVSGGYRDDSTGSITPEPETGCPQLDDPLSSLAAPAIGSCTYTGLVLDNAITTLSPGVYCDGLTIKGNSNVTFEAGTYIMKGKSFFVDSNSSVQGSGLFFYLDGKDAVIDFNSNSQVDFTASATGPYAGVLFFHSRNVSSLPIHRIDSNSNNKRLEGAIYLPNAKLLVDSNGAVGGGSPCMIMIARRYEFNSNSVIDLAADRSNCSVPLPAQAGGGLRLVN
jgi:Flp pilus assembly protein TadG